MDEIIKSNRCLSDIYRTLNIIICSGWSTASLGRNVTTKDLDGMSLVQLNACYKTNELNKLFK